MAGKYHYISALAEMTAADIVKGHVGSDPMKYR